jgi:hypothetical protein
MTGVRSVKPAQAAPNPPLDPPLNPALNPPVHWLLVHDVHDAAAPWLAQQWRLRLGPRAAELLVLPAPALTLCSRWQLRVLGTDTRARLHITLGAGDAKRHREVLSEHLRGVLYRPGCAWVQEAAADRDYLLQERQALLVAWLHGLGPRCVNRPSVEALGGPAWPVAQWRWQAQRCGLRVQAWPDGAEPTHGPPLLRLVVVGDRCFSVNGPPLDASWQAGARCLAAAAGCQLLGLYLAPDGCGGWRVAQASAQPDLRPVGPPAAAALADLMGLPAAPQAVALQPDTGA